MGQYCYLINKEKRIRAEAYKSSGGGKEVLRIEQSIKLAKFLDYCRENKLQIECVSEHYFTDIDDDLEHPFKDF